MVQPTRQSSTVTPIGREKTTLPTERSYDNVSVRQAYNILHLGFALLPVVAGLDKFFNFLVNWNQYLAPQIDEFLGGNSQAFMLIVGVIEVIVGIGVALKPKVFSYIVAAWLAGIVVNLLMTDQYYDIALRDTGLAMGAFALARLSSVFDRQYNGKNSVV